MKVKNNMKKIAFKIIKPFLPFIAIIIGLFFCICLIIDTVFVNSVQADSSEMSIQEKRIKQLCIDKANYLNICNNYIGNEKTSSLLDANDRENSKKIEWAHLYTIMIFSNMTNNREINETLLNEIGNEFKSTFKYEKYIVKTENTITSIDENGNETTSTTIDEKIQYLLIESDTIIGHYKYYYEEKVIESGNAKTTLKAFTHQELIGEKYERLKNYLKYNLRINDENIDTDTTIIIEAANGFYDGEENIDWLESGNNNIITDGKGLVPTRYVYMADTWIHKNYISIWYEIAPNL